MSPKRTASDRETWEAYRLHQLELLRECLDDADLMLKRTKGLGEEDRRWLVGLLWDKRCQPWKYFRDEQRALVHARN